MKELIGEASKFHHDLNCFAVLLVDVGKTAYNRIRTTEDISNHFPNLSRRIFNLYHRGDLIFFFTDGKDPKAVLQHFVILFKELSFDIATSYSSEWKPELLVQYENLETQFFADNFLRILRYMKLRPTDLL